MCSQKYLERNLYKHYVFFYNPKQLIIYIYDEFKSDEINIFKLQFKFQLVARYPYSFEDFFNIIRFNCYQLKRFINSKANVYSFCSYGSAILILSRFVTREFISPVRLYIRVLSCIIYQLSEIFSTKVSTFTSSYTSK